MKSSAPPDSPPDCETGTSAGSGVRVGVRGNEADDDGVGDTLAADDGPAVADAVWVDVCVVVLVCGVGGLVVVVVVAVVVAVVAAGDGVDAGVGEGGAPPQLGNDWTGLAVKLPVCFGSWPTDSQFQTTLGVVLGVICQIRGAAPAGIT
jgi:hypothetical protein